jgi:hypothetical protein
LPNIAWETEAEENLPYAYQEYISNFFDRTVSSCNYIYINNQNDKILYPLRGALYYYKTYYLWARVRAEEYAPYNYNRACFGYDLQRLGCIEYLPPNGQCPYSGCEWKWLKTRLFYGGTNDQIWVTAQRAKLNIDKIIITEKADFVPTDNNNLRPCNR